MITKQNSYPIEKKSFTYLIAGLLLEVSLPEGLNRTKVLPTFEPFLLAYESAEKYACVIELSYEHLEISESKEKLLSDRSVVWGERFRFYERENTYITTIQGEYSEDEERTWKMKSTKDFSQSTIFILSRNRSNAYVINWLTMVAFGQACLSHQTILIHASAIMWQGKGYAFLGKSGTGKSTHSKLWLTYIEGAELLNDDNPAIRINTDGNVFIYGTPWSGKTHCYKNNHVPLQGLVRLKQAHHNQLTPKNGVNALLSVLPSCTGIRWNKQLFAQMTTTAETIVQKIAVVELENLPNKEAAVLCSTKLSDTTTFYNTN